MIAVKIVAPFTPKNVDAAGQACLPERTSLAGLLRRVGAPLWFFMLPVTVNGCQRPKTYRLKDGDVVVFIMPISGG